MPHQDAIREAEKAIRIDPGFARGYMRKGNALESYSTRLNEAMSAYKKGADIDPEDQAIRRAIDSLEKRMEDIVKARKVAAEAAEQKVTSETQSHKEEGNKMYRSQKFKQAVEQYTKAIDASELEGYEEVHLLYGNRSVCHLKMKQFDESLSDADECIKLKPDWFTGYVRRGESSCIPATQFVMTRAAVSDHVFYPGDALQKQGEFELARLAYLQGLKLNPTNANLKGSVAQMDQKLHLSGEGGGNLEGEHGDGFVGDDDEEENLYAILGLEKATEGEFEGTYYGVTDDEIRKAYRKMSRRWHPDKNPGDVQAEMMSRKINHAHIVLSSPVTRRAYDKYGHQGLEMIDQIGEENFVVVESWEPYFLPCCCCFCLFALPTLCYCCWCCNCCCGYLKKDIDEEYYDEEDYEDLETGRAYDPDGEMTAPGQAGEGT